MKSLMSSRVSSLASALAIALLASVSTNAETAATAASAPAAGAKDAAAPAAPEPADSTVVSTVTIDGTSIKITYGQVKDKLKLLPPQLQNAPFKEIFPLLQKSVATEQIIMYLAEKAGVKNKSEYQKLVEEAKKGVLQKLFLDGEIDKRATEAELLKAYEEVKKAAPKEDEYNVSLITVIDKENAGKLAKEVKKAGVAKFADFANKESMNKIPDGNLGYMRLSEMPEAFRDKVKGAAKATILDKPIEITMPDPQDPNKKVTSYNIILVQDKRPATFPAYEAVKGELKSAISAKLAKEAIKELEAKATVAHMTMDGKPMDQKADAPKTAPAA